MTKTHSKYIIVGAGLSGLTAAYELYQQGEHDFIILEGRNRIGGRIYTQNGIALGATWYQNYHKNLATLMGNLGIEKFTQYAKGTGILTYNDTAPAHYFESDPNSPSAYRIAGGSISIIQKLAAPIAKHIVLSTHVNTITSTAEGVSIDTHKHRYTAQKVIVTLPPQLASCIQYTPTLPSALQLSLIHI